jgi:hypothetical protein
VYTDSTMYTCLAGTHPLPPSFLTLLSRRLAVSPSPLATNGKSPHTDRMLGPAGPAILEFEIRTRQPTRRFFLVPLPLLPAVVRTLIFSASYLAALASLPPHYPVVTCIGILHDSHRQTHRHQHPIHSSTSSLSLIAAALHSSFTAVPCTLHCSTPLHSTRWPLVKCAV